MSRRIIQRIGLISDTHGLLRPEALAFLRGCSHIIHGGDVGGKRVIEELRSIAPVTLVRGNNDIDEASQVLPHTEFVRLGAIGVLAVHDRATLGVDWRVAGIQVLVFGHSHKPSIEAQAGVLFVNPGSAGPRRFKLPVTIGELLIDSSGVAARVIDLENPARLVAGASLKLDQPPDGGPHCR